MLANLIDSLNVLHYLAYHNRIIAVFFSSTYREFAQKSTSNFSIVHTHTHTHEMMWRICVVFIAKKKQQQQLCFVLLHFLWMRCIFLENIHVDYSHKFRMKYFISFSFTFRFCSVQFCSFRSFEAQIFFLFFSFIHLFVHSTTNDCLVVVGKFCILPRSSSRTVHTYTQPPTSKHV